jgi:hypothetical protein
VHKIYSEPLFNGFNCVQALSIRLARLCFLYFFDLQSISTSYVGVGKVHCD